MTESAQPVADTSKADAAFLEVQAACVARAVACARLESKSPTWLGVELTGTARKWPVYVDCDEELLRLPHVSTDAPTAPLAHVSYGGTVCIDDEQGLSLDPRRPAAIVAHAVIKAFDLLENSQVDTTTGHQEFFNELEGYWLHLPDSVRSRAYFEVDATSRLLQGFFKSNAGRAKWHFVERGAERPWDVKNDKLVAHRALYVHLDTIDLPPAKPNQLTTAFIKEVHGRLSPAQLALWDQLVGPSKNFPKSVAMLVSVPRQAGGRSLVGAAFGAKRGVIDESAPVTPLTMRRHTAGYMRERGGAQLSLQEKRVAVLGVGAIGCVVADTLAASGIGHLTLVDYDEYSEDNVFRHLLEPMYVDLGKPMGLKLQLERRYPGVSITTVSTTAQTWLKTTELNDFDGIVIAIGAPSLERWISREMRSRKPDLPVVVTWLEAFDVGGHSVLMWPAGEGCLDCLYRDDEGHESLAPRTTFLEPNQAVTRNLTGCAGAFVPYGALQARRTGLLAAEHLLVAMDTASGEGAKHEPGYRFWTGEGKLAAAQGLKVTPWFERSRLILFDEASRLVFEPACKICRADEGAP